jgi:hypothetical protein
MTRYEHIEGNRHIKTMVYYQKGHGYYLSVSLVEREDRGTYFIESFMAYSGLRTLMLEVKRQSKKAYETAVALSEDKADKLRMDVLNMNGINRNKFLQFKR